MKFSFAIVKCTILFTLVLLIFSCTKREGKPKILVFSKTLGYHHESIAEGNVAIEKLGDLNNFDVDTTTDATIFEEDSLKKYAAVVFLSTTGDVLNSRQEAGLCRIDHRACPGGA